MKLQNDISKHEVNEQIAVSHEGFTVYSRGGPSPYPVGSLAKNGTMFHMDKNRVDLVVALERPTEFEIEQYRFGQPSFGLCVHGPVIFFLSRYGSLPWGDAPYSANLNPPHLRGMPEDYAPGKRLLLQLMVIDSSTNRIAALRLTTLSPALCEMLAKLIKHQMASPVSLADYDKAITDAYAKHPTTDSMKKSAIITCSDRAVAKQREQESGVAQSEPAVSATRDGESSLSLPALFEHITLTTGHNRECFSSEVSKDALGVCHDLIMKSSLYQSLVPIPGFPQYSTRMQISATNLTAEVFKSVRGVQVRVLTMGVALAPESGEKLWKDLHNGASDFLPMVTRAELPPSRPWIAARLREGQIVAFDSMCWLGDFERCLAWAFAHYVCAEKSN